MMKLHETAVAELVHVYDMYGGYREDSRLQKALREMDFVVYERQADGAKIIVTQAEYDKQMRQQGG